MEVWKGKILKKIINQCTAGDYLCEFNGDTVQLDFQKIVCSRLFTKRDGNDIEIPMHYVGVDDEIFQTATDNTTLCRDVFDDEILDFEK